MSNELLHILVFILVSVSFVTIGMLAPLIIAPSRKNDIKISPYECGEIPIGNVWIKFNVRYYIFAILFLIFDVETAFIFPWAVVLRELGMFGFIEMVIFIAILLLGLIYPWKKGMLEWL